jgi:hypothetical protein
MEFPSLLGLNPFPASQWGPEDKPVCVLDGVVHRIREDAGPLRGSAAYVVGINEHDFGGLCGRLDVEALHFYEMRVANIQPITRLQRLRGVAIVWNTKLSDIGPLAELRALSALRLSDTPRVFDLSALCSLSGLSFLEISGGVWNKSRVATLDPVGALAGLRELVLMNISVETGGLKPLAKCRELQRLDVSNQFPTEDYALLSVALPSTQCDMFAPYVRLDEPLEGKDAMVVGKGKPFLSTASDGPRLARYTAQFEALRATARHSLGTFGQH